jgi:uncharacterized protein (TIGR02246 family)
MKMRTMAGRLGLMFAFALAAGLSGAAEPGAEAKAVFATYVKEFNGHVAKEVAGHWTTDAVYLDTETGDRTEGREALQKDYEELFKSRPNVRLELNVEDVRQISSDVVIAHGRAKVTGHTEEPINSAFTAVLVKSEGKWLISNLQESNVPPVADAPEGLKDLEWLVGKWKDDVEGDVVETEVRWAVGGGYLVRTFRSIAEEGSVATSQIIAWDPRDESIRSWSFDSEGSFGEETWKKKDDGWNIHLVRTLADGGLATGTQVVRKVSENEFTVQLVGAEVDGAMIPTGPVIKVVRVRDTASAR